MNFLQTKTGAKNMNFKCYDLYYTVNKNGDEKEIVNNQYQNDFINFNDVVPNHLIGRKMVRNNKVDQFEVLYRSFQNIYTI